MKIIEIDFNRDSQILQEYLDKLGDEKKKFRYFNTRDLSVIKNHLVTLLVIENEIPIGYGHLDLFDDTVWLGVSVQFQQQGKGVGNYLIESLLNKARKLNLKEITLTVDLNNKIAQNLYKKFNFIMFDENHLYRSYKLFL